MRTSRGTLNSASACRQAVNSHLSAAARGRAMLLALLAGQLPPDHPAMNQRVPSGPAARAMLENLIREPQFLVTAREGFEVYLELEKDEVDEVEDVVKTAFKQMRDVWNDNNARKFKEIGAEMMEDLEKIPSWRTFAEYRKKELGGKSEL